MVIVHVTTGNEEGENRSIITISIMVHASDLRRWWKRRGANSPATGQQVSRHSFECKYVRSIVGRRRFSTAFHCTAKFIGHFSRFRLPHSHFFPYLFPGVKRGDLGEMRDLQRNARGDRERVVKLLLRSIAKLIRLYGMRPADARRRNKTEK